MFCFPLRRRFAGLARSSDMQTRSATAHLRVPPVRRDRQALDASAEESSESDSTPPPRDDRTASSSDGDEPPEFYTPPAPASTLPPGKLPAIGRPGRPCFGCGRRSPPPSPSLAARSANSLRLPSRRKDAALTGAAVRRRPQSPIYVDFLYLELIVGPALRRIFAVDTLHLGEQPPLSSECGVAPHARPRAPAWTESLAPASNGVDCSGKHQGQLAGSALQENFWRPAGAAGAPPAKPRPPSRPFRKPLPLCVPCRPRPRSSVWSTDGMTSSMSTSISTLVAWLGYYSPPTRGTSS